ncbi:PaaI family thioesterase [Maricaulis sp.]|uniref:PaaI family thioesterase n=1 Tax=Maricaulis sp. TaxID=1486257 RepID=UPI00262905BB|nr:PaaI family thioesterase [Maricaulis sp.]
MSETVVMSASEVSDFLDEVFPQIHQNGRVYTVETIESSTARVRYKAGEDSLRPGGTVSGPAIMALADFAAYVVILGHVGRQALAVTTNININYLRKAGPGDLICQARLLKLGKRLAVVDCLITTDQDEDAVIAQASATYSLPEARKA